LEHYLSQLLGSYQYLEPTPFPGFFDSFSQSGLKLSSNIKGKQREVIPETPPRNFRRESPVASLSRNIESLDDVDRNPMLAANPELANGHPEQGTIPSDDPLNGQLRTELSWTDEVSSRINDLKFTMSISTLKLAIAHLLFIDLEIHANLNCISRSSTCAIKSFQSWQRHSTGELERIPERVCGPVECPQYCHRAQSEFRRPFAPCREPGLSEGG
jgi:hypothetical protein